MHFHCAHQEIQKSAFVCLHHQPHAEWFSASLAVRSWRIALRDLRWDRRWSDPCQSLPSHLGLELRGVVTEYFAHGIPLLVSITVEADVHLIQCPRIGVHLCRRHSAYTVARGSTNCPKDVADFGHDEFGARHRPPFPAARPDRVQPGRDLDASRLPRSRPRHRVPARMRFWRCAAEADQARQPGDPIHVRRTQPPLLDRPARHAGRPGTALDAGHAGSGSRASACPDRVATLARGPSASASDPR